MSIDKKFGPYVFSVHLFGFKCKDSSLSKTFLFICQNRAAHKNIKLKLIKKFEPYFFLCVYAFSSAKIQLCQKKDMVQIFLSSVILILKCVAQRNTILTNKKKSFWKSWIFELKSAQKKEVILIFLTSDICWCFYMQRTETGKK